MPGLQQLYEEYKYSGLEVVGTSVDNFGMDDRIKLFTERMNITYPIWHDPKDSFTRTFKAIGVPESYLIDKNGTIYHTWKGQFNPTAESTKLMVEDALLKVSPAFASTQTPSNSSLSASSLITADQGSNTDTGTGSDITTIGIPLAFAAGLLSFLSPCILPIIPSFVAFITGMSSDESLNKNNKRKSISDKDGKSSSTIGSTVDIKADVSGIEKAED